MPRRTQNSKTETTSFIMRMSADERARLRELAKQLNLSQAAFIRAKIFDGLPAQAQKSNLGLDYEALSKLLLLLGESRLASNLNQLAKHANMGTLKLKTSEIEAQLNEAYFTVQWMRRTLIKTLGLQS